MAKKKMELEAEVEAKRLEETERLVEDAKVVVYVGEAAAGLTGVVSADLAIYDDDDFLLDLGFDGDNDEVPPRVPRHPHHHSQE